MPLAYFKDVLLRLAHCTDISKLTPHGWKQHFAAEVESDRNDLIRRLLGRTAG